MNSAHIDANLKVLLLDTDYYALHAVNNYLAWDRRTRVTRLSESPEDMWRYLNKTPLAELPDVVVLDADHLGGAAGLKLQIDRLHDKMPKVMIFCLSQTSDAALIETALTSGCRAYLLKNEVRMHIAWAIVYALDHPLIVTRSIARAAQRVVLHLHHEATMLPPRRQYPELTDRVRQALELCVVNGMPAQLAADEMGISLHTIRSYIKEGYRILEAYDETEYPDELSPQERAFMRLTAFDESAEEPYTVH
jgi:DNA-binding NarL/FixJ family response regulator